MKKKEGKDMAEALPEPDAPDESTQAQRDKPFQKRLSEIIQAETEARTAQVARSQERQAETRRQQDNITKEQDAP